MADEVFEQILRSGRPYLADICTYIPTDAVSVTKISYNFNILFQFHSSKRLMVRVLFQECPVPAGLTGVPYIDVKHDVDWWEKLLPLLVPQLPGETSTCFYHLCTGLGNYK